MKAGSPFILSLILGLFLFIEGSAIADAPSKDPGYTNLLIQTAIENKLYENRYWHILLHYKKTLFGVKSLIDDPIFFLSPEGKVNPEKELVATIQRLFVAPGATPDVDVCNFIARYTWLKEELKVDPAKIEPLLCERVERIGATSAVLVFPGYYMNNPASMFGHTLINIRTEFKNDLLANAVNFAARTDETNGCIFAFRGITGLYKGYYSVLPYYKKILEYSDMDKRDIWEYELNLTPQELDRMVRHLRELENIYSDYYFFDENCSYNLLFLFESARPGHNLTEGFHLTTLPIDTVKVMDKNGFIESAKFRPSSIYKIKTKSQILSGGERQFAWDIIQGKRTPDQLMQEPADTDKKVVILDLAADILKYRLIKKQVTETDYKKLLLSVLKTRSKLGKGTSSDMMSSSPSPEKTHDSSLVRLGGGVIDDRAFMELGFRPAFNDINDPDFPDENGMQIQFFNAAGRYYGEDEIFEMESLDIVDINSFSSRDSAFKPSSWKVATGWKREWMKDNERPMTFYINGGTGVSYFHPIPGLFYAMVLGDVEISHHFEDDSAFGMGFEAGVVKRIGAPYKIHLYGTILGIMDKEIDYRRSIAISQRIRLFRNLHLSLTTEFSKDLDLSYQQHQMSVLWYY